MLVYMALRTRDGRTAGFPGSARQSTGGLRSLVFHTIVVQNGGLRLPSTLELAIPAGLRASCVGCDGCDGLYTAVQRISTAASFLYSMKWRQNIPST